MNPPLKLDVPFLNLLGVELHKMEGGTSEIQLNIEEKHTNSWSVAHGGVLLALVDAAMAIAARAVGGCRHCHRAGVATRGR